MIMIKQRKYTNTQQRIGNTCNTQTKTNTLNVTKYIDYNGPDTLVG